MNIDFAMVVFARG